MMRRQVLEKMPGKRAIVTGGSKGVGAVIARTLAGLDLAIVGRDEAGLRRTQTEVRRPDQSAW
jgi:short-subunit dehydrogenase